MVETRILWIEGKRADSPSFVSAVRKKGYEIEVVASGKEALASIIDDMPDVVVINAASLNSNGKRICKALRRDVGTRPIFLISTQELGVPQDVQANEVLLLPFTARKLLNRLKSYLPGRSKRVIKAGAITLDLERNTVRCGRKKERLTPRLVELLKLLMEHPGEVLERKDLFATVWQTEYTGDTRTLDVHISWLRQALEDNPRRPKFLKTIRGLGYRLDV